MTNLVEFPALGLKMEINNIAFSIGDFSVYWYGLLIGGGMLLALLFCFSKARSFGIDDDKLVDVVFVTTIIAIIGARAYYVMFAPFKYESFWDMINIRDGGLAIYGAVICAAVFGTLMCKWRKIPILPSLDIAAMGFLIGQGVGRWGNFFNQEAFGANTNSLFGMYSPATSSYLAIMQKTLAEQGVTVDPTMPVHPTFLYESVWCFIGFALLALHIKRRRFDGEIAVFYAIWYGLGRFFIEGLRTDSLMTSFLNLRTSQIVAFVSVLGGIIVWLCMKKRNKGVTPPLPNKSKLPAEAIGVIVTPTQEEAQQNNEAEIVSQGVLQEVVSQELQAETEQTATQESQAETEQSIPKEEVKKEATKDVTNN